MSLPHPLLTLKNDLETARFGLINKLASDSTSEFIEVLQQLSHLQTALTAVREEIESHGSGLGWGGEIRL